MAITTQTDSTTATDEQLPDRSEPTTDSRDTTPWTERCGAPMTFDPTSGAAMGQFETAADESPSR